MRGGYRQGTVLGLTIAEIFILLIFLLLLAMLTLNSQWNEKNKVYEETLAELRSANTDEPFITPEQIETLYVRMTEAEQARERYQEALRNLSTTLRHRRFLFTDSFLLLWKWRVG